jgi:hypothetical protein
MRASDVREQLGHKPFRPFRLHLTDGTVFDISHPDLALVFHAVVKIGLPPALGLERDAVIDLLHIMWLEILGTPSAASSEGPGHEPGEPSPPA